MLWNVIVVVEHATVSRHIVDVVRRITRARGRKVEAVDVSLRKAHESRFATPFLRELNSFDRRRATELGRHVVASFGGSSGQVLVMHGVWYTRRVSLSLRREKKEGHDPIT